jgi:hypothetical protein
VCLASGCSVWLVIRRVCCLHGASSGGLTTRSRRTASPPLNSSVRRQSSFPSHFVRVLLRVRRRALLRAGLRCRLSRAWSPLASGARWCISHLRTSPCARFVAAWRLSSAVRSSCAGHKFRGIAEHSKQRYRAGHRRRSVLPSNKSFKRTAAPPLNSSVSPHSEDRNACY